MPLYEYLCHSCGKKFEVIQKFSDEPLKIHEECGGEAERLISAPAFHFKGTGWYVTDYAKGNSGAPKSDGGKTDSERKIRRVEILRIEKLRIQSRRKAKPRNRNQPNRRLPRASQRNLHPPAHQRIQVTKEPRMLATGSTVAEEILDLKRERRAILLAHHYQEAEIQELADFVGDSLELARKAAKPKATSSRSAASGSWPKPPRF